MNKITIYRDGPLTNFGAPFVAIDEDGKLIASHFCSNHYFARQDMCSENNTHWDIYKERYPDGFEIIDNSTLQFSPTEGTDDE